jgi:hypothetical protein
VMALRPPVTPSMVDGSRSLAKGSEKPWFLGDHGTQSLFQRFKLKIQMKPQ